MTEGTNRTSTVSLDLLARWDQICVRAKGEGGGGVRRFVTMLVVVGAAVVGSIAATTSTGATQQRFSMPRAVSAKKPAKKSKAVMFAAVGTFQGATIKGKAGSNTVLCSPSGDFFNGIWSGHFGATQLSINFQTRTGTAPTVAGANTASLIVNDNQQNGLGATSPTITVGPDHKSGTFDAQFIESGSPANSIQVKGPFKCRSQ